MIPYHGYTVWPCYEFDDIDIAAAQDPANKYDFAVQVDGVPAHSAIWAHGADARTYFLRRDVPASAGDGCAYAAQNHAEDSHVHEGTSPPGGASEKVMLH